MERWEYRILTVTRGFGIKGGLQGKHTDEMNALGLEGWELVSVTADSSGGTFGSTTGHSLIFKRRLNANPTPR